MNTPARKPFLHRPFTDTEGTATVCREVARLPLVADLMADLDPSDPTPLIRWVQILLSAWSDGVLLNSTLENEARAWLTAVKALLPDLPLANVPSLLEAYDLLHRAVKDYADTAYCDSIRRSAFDRWLKGDKSITTTALACLLWPMVEANPRAADPRHLSFCLRQKEKWLHELLRGGEFHDIPAAEALQRLAYLDRADLTPYIAGGSAAIDAARRRWRRYAATLSRQQDRYFQTCEL